jgi:hypothetical protein
MQAGGRLQLHQLVVGLGVTRLSRLDALLISIPVGRLAALPGAGAQARLGLAIAGRPTAPAHVHVDGPPAVGVGFGVQVETDGHSGGKTLCQAQRVVVGNA